MLVRKYRNIVAGNVLPGNELVVYMFGQRVILKISTAFLWISYYGLKCYLLTIIFFQNQDNHILQTLLTQNVSNCRHLAKTYYSVALGSDVSD